MYFIKSFLLITTRFIYAKLHKFSNFENSKFYLFFHLLWIFLIGSNHGKRYRLYLGDKKKNEFKEINWKIKKKNIKIIYFLIGDSNTEHLGRNYLNTDNINIFYTIWTGPTLLINFCKSKIVMQRILFLTKFFINYHGTNSKFHFIFSFVQIDIRTIFYNFLIIEKYFKNSKTMISEYINNLNETLSILRNELKRNKKSLKLKFYFKEINPSSARKGTTPKKNKIIAANKKMVEPIFGSLKQRQKWRNELNSSILKNKKKKYEFLHNLKEITKKRKDIFNNKLGDGNHLTNSKLIIKFQKKIIYKK